MTKRIHVGIDTFKVIKEGKRFTDKCVLCFSFLSSLAYFPLDKVRYSSAHLHYRILTDSFCEKHLKLLQNLENLSQLIQRDLTKYSMTKKIDAIDFLKVDIEWAEIN